MSINITQTIRRILREEVEKRASAEKSEKRVPEVVHDEDYKKISPHEPDKMSKDELLNDMAKTVGEINKDYSVIWDDHDDISIRAEDLFKIRVIPKWENSYCIEIYTKNEDRVYITGQTWEQAKEIVKSNLKGDKKTAVKSAYDKCAENRKDASQKADKGIPQKDKPKTLPHTDEPPKSEKNKEKTHSEPAVKKDEDLPEKPMKEVGEIKKQIDHKVKDPVKLKKKTPDKKLVVKSK